MKVYDIPQDWIKGYIDKLLEVAKTMPENSPMRALMLLRAEYVMDLVKAYRESE